MSRFNQPLRKNGEPKERRSHPWVLPMAIGIAVVVIAGVLIVSFVTRGTIF